VKRSARVRLSLVTGVAAALLAGCDHDIEGLEQAQAQVCANEEGVIVPDDHCLPKPQATASTSDNVRSHSSGPIFVHGGYGYPYGWRYYPPTQGSTAVGSRIPSTAVRTPVANLMPPVRTNTPTFKGWATGGFGKSGGISSGRGGGFGGSAAS
jgi:hypothetical protein